MYKYNENLLQSLLIKNFKSIGETSKVDFRNLTLLCGNNSSGKSTIINSLILLAQQSHSKNKLEEIKFSLNGVVQQLGSIQSVKNKNAKSELSLGILGKNQNGKIFFQVSLDELNDGQNICYAKYIADYLEDYDGNPGDPVNYMTQAFELSYFENELENTNLLEKDIPEELKNVLEKYINFQNSNSNNFISSLNFNAKEYEFAFPKSLLGSEDIKNTFLSRLSELDKEDLEKRSNIYSESFNGVLFRDGFPSNQLKRPTKFMARVMEDLKTSFLEYDWESLSYEINEFLLSGVSEETHYDYEQYTSNKNESKNLNLESLREIISKLVNKKEIISNNFVSLFKFGLSVQMINDLNKLQNKFSNEKFNLSNLLGIISLSLYGIDISKDKLEKRRTSKRNYSIDELLTVLFTYNILNIDEFQQFGPIQEGMYEFIISSLINNSEGELKLQFIEIQDKIKQSYVEIENLKTGEDLSAFEVLAYDEARIVERDRYLEAGMDYDPDDAPDQELVDEILNQLVDEEIYHKENIISSLYDDFSQLLPIGISEVISKIERINNFEIFFYNNSEYQNVEIKQLELIIEELNNFFDEKYFIKSVVDSENPRIKKSYLESKFSIQNIDTNLLIYDNSDTLHQSYKDTQYILNHIKYLGPLRDRSTSADSDKLYPEITPLGINGENFIKHYEFFKYKKIDTVLPYIELQDSSAGDNHKDVEETISENTIFKQVDSFNVSEAFNWWIKYFELGQYFKVVENTDKPSQLDSYIKPIDLDDVVSPASVGVGFSQIAPIILMCLTAEKNDILIFEQPELHLHPGLQQKLGDFFLQMSKLGIQIIIETHSDHILNRVRLRSFEEIESFSDSVNIVFVEKENNESRFNQFKISHDGDFDFETYPKGFFDQTSKDTFKLLKAKALKQQQKKQKEENELTEDEAPF